MSIWTRKKADSPLLVLSPMAGYTDSAFRELCRGFGADITISELVSADSIYHNKKIRNQESGIMNQDFFNSDKTLKMMQFSEGERPFVIQLFGKFPEKFAYAANWVEKNLKPDGIDINMGCPSKKVVGSDHGAALLKNHNLAVKIVTAVRGAISIPLSVKTRLGWEDDDEILDFAPKLVEAGVDALIIHGRTYSDGFRNTSRWRNIYKVKSQISNDKLQIKYQNPNNKSCHSEHVFDSTHTLSGVERDIESISGSRVKPGMTEEKNHGSVSIIGNGDINNHEEAIEKTKNLDGVAIGRATFGHPWIFDSKFNVRTSNFELRSTILRHAKLVYERKADHGIIEFRKHLVVYLRGQGNAKLLRKEAVCVETVKDVEKVIEQIK